MKVTIYPDPTVYAEIQTRRREHISASLQVTYLLMEHLAMLQETLKETKARYSVPKALVPYVNILYTVLLNPKLLREQINEALEADPILRGWATKKSYAQLLAVTDRAELWAIHGIPPENPEARRQKRIRSRKTTQRERPKARTRSVGLR